MSPKENVIYVERDGDPIGVFYEGRQRENLRFQPGDESRLGRPLL